LKSVDVGLLSSLAINEKLSVLRYAINNKLHIFVVAFGMIIYKD